MESATLVRLPLTENHPRASTPKLRFRTRKSQGEAGLLVDHRNCAESWDYVEVKTEDEAREAGGLIEGLGAKLEGSQEILVRLRKGDREMAR